MARFDIFYNEETGDYKFCEINTDGTSAMNEDYVLDKAFFHSPAHQTVIREYQFENFDLFTPWIETFLRLYETWDDPRGLAPHTINIAITDFMDRGVVRVLPGCGCTRDGLQERSALLVRRLGDRRHLPARCHRRCAAQTGQLPRLPAGGQRRPCVPVRGVPFAGGAYEMDVPGDASGADKAIPYG